MRRFVLAAVAMVALGLSACPAGAWWNAAWKCRRAVVVPDFQPSNLPGDDLAVVTFPTAGKTRPDARDVRVATLDDAEVPCRVLMTGPGDRVRVAFALRPKVTKYYVYYGNPDAPAGEELDIRRGVLLETWTFPGGPIRTIEQARAAFGRARALQGRDLRDRVFSAHNPFGPGSDVASIYTAWLSARAEGAYVFAIASQNASFLLVDDKLLISSGGQHAVQRRAYSTGTADLKAGPHKLTFYHLSPGGADPYAVLAWRPPWQADRERFVFVPPGAFAPFQQAAPGVMEEYGQPAGVDFIPEHLGETFTADRYYQRYGFEALAVAASPRAIRWTWEFGDGQTSAEPKVEHVYLLPGEYTVTLTGILGADKLTRTNRLRVSRPWDRVTDPRLDSVRQHAEIVWKYDFKRLPAEALGEAVLLLDRAEMTAPMMRACEAFVSLDKAPARSVEQVLEIYSEALVAAGKADQAVEALRAGAEVSRSDPAVSAGLTVKAGRLLLEEKNDPDQAAKLFQGVLDRSLAIGSAGAVRQAQIGLGDVWRAKGDGPKAAQAYQKAGERVADRPGGQPFLRGDLARHVEEYLRTRDYSAAQDYLDRWQEAFPADKLEGYWSLLRAQLFLARRQYAGAIGEAQILVKANPASNYGAELLMAAHDAHLALRQADQAKAVLRQIVKDFPESPLAGEAAKKLQGQ